MKITLLVASLYLIIGALLGVFFMWEIWKREGDSFSILQYILGFFVVVTGWLPLSVYLILFDKERGVLKSPSVNE